MLATFFYQFSIQAVTLLMNGYACNLGINSTFAGIIVGIMSITSMLLRPFAGNLTDQISKYRLALIGGSFCAVRDLGYLFASNVSWLIFFRIVNGVGFVLCTICLATWMAFLVPRQHLGAAMGYYGLVNHARLKTDACENHTLWHGDHNLLRYSASLRIGLIR